MNLVERAAKQLEADGHIDLARDLREHMNNPLDSVFEKIYKAQKKAWAELEEELANLNKEEDTNV